MPQLQKFAVIVEKNKNPEGFEYPGGKFKGHTRENRQKKLPEFIILTKIKKWKVAQFVDNLENQAIFVFIGRRKVYKLTKSKNFQLRIY